MCLCPEDVKVDVGGEVIYQGQRASIIFSIDEEATQKSSFYLESKIRPHSEDFRQRYIHTMEGRVSSGHLKFQWSGWLSSLLSITLCEAGATNDGAVKQALANLITAAAILVGIKAFRPWDNPFKACSMPLEGFRPWLGPQYKYSIQETLKLVLAEPSNINDPDLAKSYNELRTSI